MQGLDKAGRERGVGLSGAQVQVLRKCELVESVAEDDWNLTTTDSDVPEDVNGVYFMGNVTSHFGVAPLLGRGLIEADAPDGGDPQPVVVLGINFARDTTTAIPRFWAAFCHWPAALHGSMSWLCGRRWEQAGRGFHGNC